jgi:hypothetical protein
MAIITGTIKVNVVNVTHPEFTGIYTGDFSYDDRHLTKVGEEVMTINGGNGYRSGLLSFNFRFLDFATGLTPVTYTARDVDEFPDDLPVLTFLNGIPTQFGLRLISAYENDAFGFLDSQQFLYALRNGTVSGWGIVTLEINESPPHPVPENASPLASLLAFLGFGGVHLWRKSRKANN